MRGKIFWKGIVVFGLTFGVSAFVSGLFISKQLPAQNVEMPVNSAATENNCVPVDKNLKYENLPLREPNIDFPEKTENSGLPVIKSDEKKSVKKTAESAETRAEKQRLKKLTEPHRYAPQKDSAEYQTLLHKEQCFAAQEQK